MPGVFTLKLFTAVINNVTAQDNVIVTVIRFRIFADKTRSLPLEWCPILGYYITLPTNIRLGCKCLTVTNTLCYDNTLSITAVKKVL